ncbi:NAD-dependent histone deacetylase sirtuin-1 [Lucilia cuprina]|uniref:NAD-dependent histone deacetylase sirtuin-1 n=1 Tax=Lucilia cuprina TaxID=7375 RepID=UPI001F060562|nr:NAD-dependent histone deacetylase sirtuin-1 [Lucilia cuprina]
MMENYEQARLNSDRLEQLDDVLPIKLQERNEFFNSVEEFAVNNKQNFNFGANILNTKTMSTSSSSMASTTTATTNANSSSCGEEVVKTNNEIIKTLTLPPTADADLEASLIADTPVSVTDDPEDPFKSIMDSEEEDDDEEEEEQSYQTDNNDNSQLTQDSSQFRQSSKEHEDDDEDNPDTDDSTTDSDFSDLSGLSDMSGREWKPINQRPLNWVQKQIHSGANPREILSKFLPSSAQRISPELTDMTLWRILASMLSEPPRRKKLSYVNTFEDVIDLLNKSKNIMVLTGAGVSVSCGIPDFRSSDGIYSRLAKDFPDLPDPQAMFDINYFSRDPRPFYKFAREIYPGQFKPSPCHRFIKMLEQKQKLLRNYTQNIDTLEQVAGIKNVIECHGSFSTASCTKCKYKCDADSIRSDIFAQRIPVCPRCQPNVEQSLDASEPVSENNLRQLVENGIMKPDIVFFGEGLPDEFHTVMASDKDKCDLLIVMGSSLKVRPVALIPSSIPNHVPQILINREQLHHLEFDVELLGDGDVIINQICHRLGEDWKDICFSEEVLKESKDLIPLDDDSELDEDTAKEVSADIMDTLSMKSNHTAATPTTTTCSDSGFETSSTCSKKEGEFLSPEYMDEPMESASFGGSCDYRHLSIDSSKDSGILGDASNSALTPTFSNLMDTAELNKNSNNLNMPASTTQAINNKPVVDNLHNTKTVDTNCSEAEKQSIKRQMKHQSAAERLYKGTYYVHENTASYVFPGAQVSWCSDSEEEDDENLDEYDDNLPHNEDEDTNHAPLSPLMTPSVENEMVNAISNTTTNTQQTSNSFTNSVLLNSCLPQKPQPQTPPPQPIQTHRKRHSNETQAEPASFESTSPAEANEHTTGSNSHPPHKKRRDSAEQVTITSPNISLESS